MQNKILMGHLFALVTILLWGTTFISTKVLLRSFTPIEILFFRFIMGLIVLFLIYPYRLKVTDKKTGMDLCRCRIKRYYFVLSV